MHLPFVWFRFQDADGDEWTVLLTTRAVTRYLRGDKPGEPNVGRVHWKRRRIYIELGQTEDDLFNTTLHELAHVAIRPMKLPSGWDEELVAAAADGLWPILRAVPMNFPPVPDCLKGRIRE